MSLAVRVIACLDVDEGRVVKGVNFAGLRDAGDPVELAAQYDAQGADELVSNALRGRFSRVGPQCKRLDRPRMSNLHRSTAPGGWASAVQIRPPGATFHMICRLQVIISGVACAVAPPQLRMPVVCSSGVARVFHCRHFLGN